MCQRALCSCIQGRGTRRGSGAGSSGRQAGICGQRAGNPFGRIKGGVRRHRHRNRIAGAPCSPRRGNPSDRDQSTVNTGRGSPHRCQQMEAEHVAGDEAGPSPHHTPQSHGAGEIPDSGRNCPGIPGFSLFAGIYRDSHTEDRGPRRRGRFQCVPSRLLQQESRAGAEPAVLQADHGWRL